MSTTHNPHFLSEDELLALVDKIENQGEADWQLFLSYGEELALAPGDVLIRQFAADRVIYVLTEGELDVRMAKSRGGPERSLGAVKPVAILGEQTFFDEQPRSATIAAKTAATVHKFTLQAFDTMRIEEPEIACAFLFDVARSLSLRARPLQARAADA